MGTILAIEKEEEYQKSLYLMKCIEFMTDFKQKTNFYRQTAAQFRGLLNYKDSEQYADLCMQLAKRSKKDFKKSTYNDAIIMKSRANNADAYKVTADLFRQVPGYKDADAMALECDKISSIIMNKE